MFGSKCSMQGCNTAEDFLPFQCSRCRGTFCTEHRSRFVHNCSAVGQSLSKNEELSTERMTHYTTYLFEFIHIFAYIAVFMEMRFNYASMFHAYFRSLWACAVVTGIYFLQINLFWSMKALLLRPLQQNLQHQQQPREVSF